MYKVDTPTNSLYSLQEVSFSSLGFTERYHLQEWLAQNPQALTRDNDDELLIIPSNLFKVDPIHLLNMSNWFRQELQFHTLVESKF